MSQFQARNIELVVSTLVGGCNERIINGELTRVSAAASIQILYFFLERNKKLPSKERKLRPELI